VFSSPSAWSNCSWMRFALKPVPVIGVIWGLFPDHLHRMQGVCSNVRHENVLQDVATCYHRGCREFLM
jgi:hypothetical protein